MKTKLLALALIALMTGISSNINAAAPDTVKLANPAEILAFQASINLFPDDIVQFSVVKPEDEKVKFRVYSESGTLIYTYSLKKHTSARIGFNTKDLMPGNYTYIVEKNKKEVLRKVIAKK